MNPNGSEKPSRNSSVPGSGKSNFTTAVNEMFGLSLGKKEATDAGLTEDVQLLNDYPENNSKSNLHLLPTQPLGSTKKFSVIAEDTVIEGEIQTSNNINIVGIVKGPVSSEADIILEGKVYGNIKCNSAMIKNGLVEGNIIAKSEVTLLGDAIILGDIETDRLVSEGKVRGSIKANSSAVLNNHTVLFGNIHTRSLSVQNGVIINGQVKVITDSSVEDMFRALTTKATQKIVEDTEKQDDF